MTDPQQPGWDPNWQQPPAQPSAPPAYGQQPTPAYGQPAYGQPVYGQPVYGQPVYTRSTNGMAIAALICSLAGLVTGITAPVGAILGHIARKQIAQSGEQGDGMALAGVIVGWVVTGLYVCGCIGYIAFFAAIVSNTGGANF